MIRVSAAFEQADARSLSETLMSRLIRLSCTSYFRCVQTLQVTFPLCEHANYPRHLLKKDFYVRNKSFTISLLNVTSQWFVSFFAILSLSLSLARAHTLTLQDYISLRFF
jgi:hypothetical protein